MPGGGGLSALSAIKTDPETCTIPVMMLTGERNPATVLLAMQSGADDYVVKPFHPDALLQRVSTTVRTRSICPPAAGGPVDCDAAADAFPRRVIVVDRTAQPEVTAPLGWVLSQASMTGLDRAMQGQVDTTCATAPTTPSCLRGYGTLGDLLDYLR
jgi:hypothetical protein